MNVSMLNYLIDVGLIATNVAILFAVVYYVLHSIKNAKATPDVKPTIVDSRAPIATAKKSKTIATVPTSVEPKVVPQKVAPPIDDGLGLLIETARKNSDKCSVCAAYVIFYDKGRFKAEGMTASGMMAHFDAAHK